MVEPDRGDHVVSGFIRAASQYRGRNKRIGAAVVPYTNERVLDRQTPVLGDRSSPTRIDLERPKIACAVLVEDSLADATAFYCQDRIKIALRYLISVGGRGDT